MTTTNVKIDADGEIHCLDHPRTKNERKPRSKCITCWVKYVVENHFCLKAVETDFDLILEMFDKVEYHPIRKERDETE